MEKIFQVPMGELARGTEQVKLLNALQDPARNINIIPATKRDTLISTGKFEDAGCVSLFDKNGVKIYNGASTKIDISEETILTGWKCPDTGLFQIPLKPFVTNVNIDTVLLDNKKLRLIVESRPGMEHTINNVYELLSTVQAVRYLHAAVGFPMKATWMKAIRAGYYISWPVLNGKNINHFFLSQTRHRKDTCN